MRTAQINSGFDANAKLLNFTEKLKTASGKYRVNVVTWSFLPFGVNVFLNLSIFLDFAREFYSPICQKQRELLGLPIHHHRHDLPHSPSGEVGCVLSPSRLIYRLLVMLPPPVNAPANVLSPLSLSSSPMSPAGDLVSSFLLVSR